MENNIGIPERLLLHACCGPCSLEPVRLLRKRGIEPVIHYSNSNIAPADEYGRRLDAIREWCKEEGIGFIEDEYMPGKWEGTAGKISGPAAQDDERRRARCRACYRLRFEESARFARENGFDALGTTLSVSPYQYTEIIAEELARACEREGIGCFFEDYSLYYREATKRSRDMGMYRQVYCGCIFSEQEASMQRDERRREREARRAERAEMRKSEDEALEARRKERAEYDKRQARKRAVLKALRSSAKEGCGKSADCQDAGSDLMATSPVGQAAPSMKSEGKALS